MFPFGHNRYAPAYQSYDPFEQALLQQELQRRRQAEEYQRRRQLEALNRRRAEQLEYARRQAEIQRLREAEARRRHEMELEARRRKLSEPGGPQVPRPRIRVPEPYGEPVNRSAGRPQSMFDGGVQDLFDALYGNRGHPNASLQPNARRAKSSDPRARNPADTALAIEPTQSSAISDTEDDKPAPPSQPASSTSPAAPMDSVDTGAESIEVDTTKAQSEISNILKSLSDLKSGFSFPAKLDFLSSPGDVTVTVPKLAYTPNNAPLHQFEHLLTGLLTKLDAVDSCGQDSIRRARKDAVKAIEKELEDVDVKKLQEWQRRSQEAMAATSAPIFPDSEPPKDQSSETSPNQAQPSPDSTPQARDENEDIPPNTSSQQDDSSSIALATTPAQPADLQLSSDDPESHRTATPAPAASNPPPVNPTEAPSADAKKPSEGEAIEEGYVDIGREDAGSDNADDETTRSKANPDDSWEAEF